MKLVTRPTPRRSVRSLFALAVLTIALSAVPTIGAAEPTSAGLERFALCISESGAKFYGAHWCGYCAQQKEMFGTAAKYLPYVECFQSGTRDKLSKCRHIDGFPRWIYSDGTVGKGRKSLASLAAATGCAAP
jgi:hypothetical protein